MHGLFSFLSQRRKTKTIKFPAHTFIDIVTSMVLLNLTQDNVTLSISKKCKYRINHAPTPPLTRQQ